MITVTIEEREKISEIIKENMICYVGMIDVNNMPYVIPMIFGFDDVNNIFYLHSAPEGSHISALKKNSNVCITISSDPTLAYHHEEVACSYRIKGSSVICRGKVVFIEDCDEKIKALDIIMKQYTDLDFKYSEPSVKNVKVWKIEIENISMRIFGAPNPKSIKYSNPDLSKL